MDNPYIHLSDEALTEAAYAACRAIDQLERSRDLGWRSPTLLQELAEAQQRLRLLTAEADRRLGEALDRAERYGMRAHFSPAAPAYGIPF